MAHEHELFIATGEIGAGVRPIVAESWRRCLISGVDPERPSPPVDFTGGELVAYREGHPLAGVMPVIRRLLVEDAADASLLVAVTDAQGRLLWVEGEHRLRSQAENMHFVEGALWSEDRAGTNAPGTALALNRSVQIFSSEHFASAVTAWSCSAAPIHDPTTGALLGALDLTGGDHIASPQTLTLVRSAVAAVEAELQLQGLRKGSRSALTDTAFLSVLGKTRAVLTSGGRTVQLSLRHSELLLLLAEHPEGLSSEQIDVALHDHDGALVTVRAEMSRLRPLLGGLSLLSRPYRLTGPLETDLANVRRRLADGECRRALEAYRGSVLPASEAPWVRRLRAELHGGLRAALLHQADPDLLLRYCESPDGRDDQELWQACLSALPPGSPRRPWLRAQLERINDELGLPPRR
jgi:hypothetical protein